MDILIEKASIFDVSLPIPPSKSHSQRVLAMALLLEGTEIYRLGDSYDELSALGILQDLGLQVKIEGDKTTITNGYQFDSDVVIKCGESGLSSRLFGVLMASNDGHVSIEGSGTLLNRSMGDLCDALDQLGIAFASNGGKLPITYRGGQSESKAITLNGNVTSQVITGSLFYAVKMAKKDVIVIQIENPSSIPYLKLTCHLLSQIGANIKFNKEWTEILVAPSVLKRNYSTVVESDWSSAAFWCVAAAIGGKVALLGLCLDSIQADRMILEVLGLAGALVAEDKQTIFVEKHELNAFEWNADSCPDLVPIISVLALFCDGISVISGVSRLQHKESDRLSAIVEELSKVNNAVSTSNDQLFIEGKNWKKWNAPLLFETYNDHRMVMSLSILSMFLPFGGNVSNLDCVKKSYSKFFDDLRRFTSYKFAE
jgi:3-phosphoshikimate 1-carboxyvinyltransferase